ARSTGVCSLGCPVAFRTRSPEVVTTSSPSGGTPAGQPTVRFTAMVDGTTEDYELLLPNEERELAQVPDRILGWLRAMDEHTGYQVTRLGHSLQAATRALRAGEDEEMVVCALVHDGGGGLAAAKHA